MLTEMQVEARVKPCPPTMPDKILCCFQSSKVLVAFPYRVVFVTAIVAVCHQDGNLRAQLGQFEGAYTKSAQMSSMKFVSLTGYGRNCGASRRSCETKA